MIAVGPRPCPPSSALPNHALRLGAGLCLLVALLSATRLLVESWAQIWVLRASLPNLLGPAAWAPICLGHAGDTARDPRWLKDLGMWSAMLLLTMAPSVTPAWRALSQARVFRAYEILSGYCAPWLCFSACAVIFEEGARLAAPTASTMRWSVATWSVATLSISVGIYQLSPWRAQLLQAWRRAGLAPQNLGDANAGLIGLRLGSICVGCNAPLMALIGLIGMNPSAMVASAALTGLERWSSSPWISRASGLALVIFGGLALVPPDF